MTEIDRYLKSARVKDVKDPLQWWMDNQASYPCLSRMAKDFLVIPGEFYLYLCISYLSSHLQLRLLLLNASSARAVSS